MRILIIGAGNTGRNLATRLCQMHHDITVVDCDSVRLERMEAEADVLTILGGGASPATLEEAGLSRADLLIAVTNRDEVNILACQLAHAVGVTNKVARVSDTSLAHTEWMNWSQLGVDLLISHKEETAREIASIVTNPGTLEVVELLGGRVLVVGIRVPAASPLLRGSLLEIREAELFNRLRFIAVMRKDDLMVPTGETTFRAGDDVYVALRPEHLSDTLDWIFPDRPTYSNLIIAGGGELGLELARRMDGAQLSTTMVERDADRAMLCSGQLSKVLVLNGDVTDRETLLNAGVAAETAFVAITGDEELNIVSCVLAHELGAGFTLAQVAKPEYVPIVRALNHLDRVVSPHLSMINAILHFVRGRNVMSAALLHKLPGELLQMSVPEKHRWIGKTIRDIKAPAGTVVVTVLRDGEINVPTGDYEIGAGDQLVIFCKPEAVERIQVALK